jgi:hypothetical protein
MAEQETKVEEQEVATTGAAGDQGQGESQAESQGQGQVEDGEEAKGEGEGQGPPRRPSGPPRTIARKVAAVGRRIEH